MLRCYWFLLGVLLLITFHVDAQTNVVSGVVLDSESKEPLPFVSVIDLGRKSGSITDIDGKFTLQSTASIRNIRLSYVGYETDTVPTEGKKSLKLYMNRATLQLNEFTVYPGENPAHRIIKKAVENRSRNNPNEYSAYVYSSYNKIYATLAPTEKDWEEMQKEKADSLRKVLEEQHFFFMESFTERRFMQPNLSKEIVKGTKVSGFKNPAFSFLPTDLQPFGFYDTYVQLFDKEYLNPISQKSWNKYVFELQDTLYQNRDSVFVIRYKPGSGKNFEGLEGVLYISTDGFALQNVIAENHFEGINEFRIQQEYSKVDSLWFPDQLRFELLLTGAKFKMAGVSYIDEVNLTPDLDRSMFSNVVVEIPDSSGLRDQEFWMANRADSLSSREQRTYTVVDSIGEELNFERIINISEQLVTGRLPLGPVEVSIDQLLQYNQFEGFRTGIGLYTGDQISRYFSVGGYGAYGFGDREWKYGGSIAITPTKVGDFAFRLGYSRDVHTPGTSLFYDDHVQRTSDQWRAFLSDWMNYSDRYRASVEFRALRYAKFELFGQFDRWEFSNNYRYRTQQEEALSIFRPGLNVATAGIRMRYAYGEKLIRSRNGLLSLGTGFPVFWVNYTRGIEDIENSNRSFNKIEGKVFKRFKSRVLGEFSLALSGGYIDNSMPVNYMFVGNGTLDEELQIVVNNTFQTMGLFEFMHSRYASLHYNHRLWRWYSKWEYVRPEFFMVHSLGYGDVDPAELDDHKGFSFKRMNKGYFESGLLINHLVRLKYADALYLGLGCGGFYRYGTYANENWEDNVALKIAITAEL